MHTHKFKTVSALGKVVKHEIEGARVLSYVRFFVTPQPTGPLCPWDFPYWSRLPFPPPQDLPDPGTEPTPPALAGGFFTTKSPGKPMVEGSSSQSGGDVNFNLSESLGAAAKGSHPEWEGFLS